MKRKFKPKGIQSSLMIAFSGISVFIMIVLGITLYIRFYSLSRQETIDSTKRLMEQTGENLEDYLANMRQISDAVYYNVVKEHDYIRQSQDIQNGMHLLYEADKSDLHSIAIYNDYGSLIGAEPVALQKEDPDVTKQDWFIKAMDEMENMCFSMPHIQNLFDDGTFRYYWVVSLSRIIELTEGSNSCKGVLLVDMDFSGISRMMKQINDLKNGQYYYLCSSDGEIIYHPRQVQIAEGICSDSIKETAGYKEGVYDEVFEGEKRKVVVNTISYTGWKLVGVIPYKVFNHGMNDIRYFILMLMLGMAMILVFISRIISSRISSPILQLRDSVAKYEAGGRPRIYIGGSPEIRQLGLSVQKSYEQIEELMQEIVLEQNERRKSELDALQSQIHPHFLYNTLESITWMIEEEKNDDAVFMISQLARLFRISLSKGHTVISVEDEISHAKSYMNIQKTRYKDKFSVTFDVDSCIYRYCTVKLILQPLLENAVSYGVSGMDDNGEITIRGRKKDDEIILSVSDNGMGMTGKDVALLLTEENQVKKHGSGVGLLNVNKRIQIFFGKEYGLIIQSEPDEGTTVTIRIPAILYEDENRKIIEKGYMLNREEMAEKEQRDKDEKG